MHSPVKGGGAIVSPARCDIFKSCQDENVGIAVEIASPLKISAFLKFRFSTTIGLPLKSPGDKFDPLPPLLTLQNQWVNSVSVDKLRE